MQQSSTFHGFQNQVIPTLISTILCYGLHSCGNNIVVIVIAMEVLVPNDLFKQINT